MATKPPLPPFMNSCGLPSKILRKIKDAKTPDRFTQDYLANTLGFSGSSAKPFIPLAKRLGLLSSDGTPTETYKQFRNAADSKAAMARAMRTGYADLFSRNEGAHKLDRKDLQGLVVQATGLEKKSPTLRAILGTFENLKAVADFEGGEPPPTEEEVPSVDTAEVAPQDLRLGLSYTINLVLPKTDDVAVYNAIFRAVKENLLRR